MKNRVDQAKERDLHNTIQSLETKTNWTEDGKGKLEFSKQELNHLEKDGGSSASIERALELFVHFKNVNKWLSLL